MIIILGIILFISLIMLIAGLVENVKGVWITGLVLMLGVLAFVAFGLFGVGMNMM
jgi:hypothetical protein